MAAFIAKIDVAIFPSTLDHISVNPNAVSLSVLGGTIMTDPAGRTAPSFCKAESVIFWPFGNKTNIFFLH